jgi:hypothetical protein
MRALLVLSLLATTAHADVDHEAHLGSFVRALHTSSANALTDNSLAGPDLGYAYRLPLDLGKLEVWGTGTFAGGYVDGEMFQTLDTQVRTLQLTAGARVRYPLWRKYVLANARFELGAQRVAFSVEDRAGHTARDTGWGAMSTAALGIELAPLALRSFGLSLRLELGYTFTQAVELDARSEGAPEDTIELDRMAASIGHLDLGGKVFAITVTTRF